jgi:acyl-CoA hydrolase/RimJ/RimL family protein N-acetyltransferase
VQFLTGPAVATGGRLPRRVFFVGADSRAQVAAGRAEYVPIALAEVNPRMPRTHGDSRVHVERLHHLVAVDTPVIEYLHEPVGDVAAQVARYVARIISDGATLQIGLGRVPNEMLRYLRNRRDLGIHSDVITEPLVDLVERGVVTGRRKGLDRGKLVTSWCMGSRRLYDLVDDNPAFAFRPVDAVCDPAVISAQHAMVSVTQAFAIDLTGQICADQYAGELYGGVSTQPQFHAGAARAPGGKAIVCLASTDEQGDSRIRGALRAGEAVAIARADVRYVVTEYGVAYLFGKSLRERAVALIEIAHPEHRDALLAEAIERGYVPAGQRLRSRSAYPVEEERRVRLRDGRDVLIRPARTGDAAGLQALFHHLRPSDVYTRFLTNLASLSVDRAEHLTSVNYRDEMAFVAVTGDWEAEEVVASSSYYVNPTTNYADVAYLVHPDWQGVGLGSALERCTADYARRHGLRGFTADVLTDNHAMLGVFERGGHDVTRHLEPGVYELTLTFR